jgi:hypoxanthine phosphoribosyltransferase
VLVVDDVFDTGRTAAAVRKKLTAQQCEAKIACVYWKPSKNVTDDEPDFHVRKLDEWIVFPHEIEGLTPEEIAEKDPVLAEIFGA